MFNLADVAQRAKVCVMGATRRGSCSVRPILSDRPSPWAVCSPCRVVGLLATKGYSAAEDDLDHLIVRSSDDL